MTGLHRFHKCPFSEVRDMKKKILFRIDAVFYALILFALVFLKDQIRAVNFVPFRFITDYFVDKRPLGMENIAGNILLFIPMGIFLSMKEKSCAQKMLLLIGSSVCIEVLQFVFARGVSDIDDVILNSFGGLVGIIFYRLSSILGAKSHTVLLVLIFCALFALVVLYACLHFGVFGFRIRIF